MFTFPTAALVALAMAVPLPLYTDEQAAVFAERDAKLHALVAAGKAERPRSLEAALATLEINPRRLRGGFIHTANVTFWGEFQLSDNYRLVHSYNAMLPRDHQFNGIAIKWAAK